MTEGEKAQLWALVDQWRKYANSPAYDDHYLYSQGKEGAYDDAADDLEAFLKDK